MLILLHTSIPKDTLKSLSSFNYKKSNQSSLYGLDFPFPCRLYLTGGSKKVSFAVFTAADSKYLDSSCFNN